MAFKANKEQQISFNDSYNNLTERERRFLNKSWAKPFSEHVFDAINEERFSVLYSSEYSRPNTPVNVIIGTLILKELLGLTDDEALEGLLFDIRFQYALHTTSFEEQPLSDRTLGRFRERCLTYEAETGIDLIKECINDLSDVMSSLMNKHENSNIKREKVQLTGGSI